VSMTGNNGKSEVLHGPERRRRWAAAEKVAIVAETYEPGVTVSLVARRHGVAPNQVFSWRRLAAQGALTAAGSEEEVVPAIPSRRSAIANSITPPSEVSRPPSNAAVTGLRRTAGKRNEGGLKSVMAGVPGAVRRTDRCKQPNPTLNQCFMLRPPA
jgi:transposase-like protein